MVIVGSGTLVRYLEQKELIDEYRIWVYSVIVGAGMRLFEQGSLDTSTWSLADGTTTSMGVAILTYRR